MAQKKEFEIQSIKFNQPKIDSNEQFDNSLGDSDMDSPRNELKNKMASARTFTMESPTKNTLCQEIFDTNIPPVNIDPSMDNSKIENVFSDQDQQ